MIKMRIRYMKIWLTILNTIFLILTVFEKYDSSKYSNLFSLTCNFMNILVEFEVKSFCVNIFL